MSAVRSVAHNIPSFAGFSLKSARPPPSASHFKTSSERSFSSSSHGSHPQQYSVNILGRQQPLRLLNQGTRNVFGRSPARFYSSELSSALVEVSKNIGMGSGAIGLGGAGIGIGLVFSALLQGVARNPGLRGQLFTYAMLGFTFVEAMGLLEFVLAMMIKYV